MSRSILAIDGNISHDCSVTVIREGEIFAVECERLDRVKKSAGYDFRVVQTAQGPRYQLFDVGNVGPAIRYCLELAGLEVVDTIIHTHGYKFVRFLGLERYLAPGGTIREFPSHHLAHACSAFYYSDFERAAVLVVDGSGPEAGSPFNILQSSYFFDGTSIRTVARTFATAQHQCGIGLNYYLHTLLMSKEEGSIMGLSSYGDPSRYPQQMLVEVDGHIYLDPQRIPHPITTSTNEAREDSLFSHYGIPGMSEVAEAKTHIETSFLADIAARLQQETEQRMVQLANALYEVTRCPNLCMGGGVTLNSVANHKILEQTPFERVFIQPGAHDAGITLGLALFVHHHLDKEPRRTRRNVFLGRAYTNEQIEQTLTRYADAITVERVADVVETTAALLADHQVLAWFQGRMEFGPRALGHRSILAHPGRQETGDRVNDIKRRERWRPLAPAILEDRLSDYFEMLNPNPYMLLVAQVTERTRVEAPAVVHVDGTARPQTVDALGNALFHRLITAFEARTGLPMVLNTSLNDKGEPLIEHPEQAVFFLLNSGVDALVIGDFVVRRNPAFTGSYRVEVERRADPTSPIDTAASAVALNQTLEGLFVKDLSFFKGGYHVQLEVGVGPQRRTLDLGLDVDGAKVTEVFNHRAAGVLPAKFRPLIGPFLEAFEAYLRGGASR